jgi:hypothetical protein
LAHGPALPSDCSSLTTTICETSARRTWII